MHKYKYFLMLFCCMACLLCWFYFPISFDSNDDQGIYFINSGIFSGVPGSALIHTHVFIGHILKELFLFSGKFNWYTGYLQLAQFIAIMTISYILIADKSIPAFRSLLVLLFVFLGIFALCVVKLQFTTVSLLCCAAALLCLQARFSERKKNVLALALIGIAMLIRKDSFYVFLIFNIPLVLIKLKEKRVERYYASMLAASVILFLLLNAVNNNYPAYKQVSTYTYLTALDDVVDKPTAYQPRDLAFFDFTEDDIVLMKARYPMDERYTTDNGLVLLAEKIKSTRSADALKREGIKFIQDERYLLFVYLITCLAVFFFVRQVRLVLLLNMAVLLGLLGYLAWTARIPHRVTYPLLAYVSMLNLLLLLREKGVGAYKTPVIALLFVLGCYKFYCTSKLIGIHKEHHRVFATCVREVRSHSDCFFIALPDGFPVQYMNAWTPPDNLKVKNNLMLTGWNAWAPDFRQVLKRHRLKNLSSDLMGKRNVLFLTDDADFQQAFVSVMKERYRLACHFEPVTEGFKVLQPKRLVFDN